MPFKILPVYSICAKIAFHYVQFRLVIPYMRTHASINNSLNECKHILTIFTNERKYQEVRSFKGCRSFTLTRSDRKRYHQQREGLREELAMDSLSSINWRGYTTVKSNLYISRVVCSIKLIVWNYNPFYFVNLSVINLLCIHLYYYACLFCFTTT